jgi:ATP-binding cassette, subfamily C (CFTR/MRP), member 1
MTSGVVLSYTLGITQTFCKFLYPLTRNSLPSSTATMVQLFAQNEQNMNAVERVLVYSKLPTEGDTQTPNDPPASWPEMGEIKFIKVKLAYREGLPLVLKGVSFEVAPGEKV